MLLLKKKLKKKNFRVEFPTAIEKWAQIYILFDIINFKMAWLAKEREKTGTTIMNRFAISLRRYFFHIQFIWFD